MPDYGHSKGYALLPNFCPETDPLNPKDVTEEDRRLRERQESKDKARREKESKIEYIMLQKAVSNNAVDQKNREKYDIQLIKKSQEFTYKQFKESRFTQIIRKAKQNITLGEDEGK